jgi:hypothetical protein
MERIREQLDGIGDDDFEKKYKIMLEHLNITEKSPFKFIIGRIEQLVEIEKVFHEVDVIFKNAIKKSLQIHTVYNY